MAPKKPRTRIWKRNRNIGVGVGLLFIITASILVWGIGFGGFLAGAPATTTTYDYYRIALYDEYDTSEDYYEIDNNSAILWYKVKTTTLDAEEIADLTFSDFTFSVADDDVDYDEDYEWICKISHTGFVPKYYVTSTLLFEGNCPVLSLGTNNVFLTNQTEDVSQLAYSKYSLDPTIAETLEANWMVLMQCLDGAEGTGKPTDLEGYTPYYCPESASYQRTGIKITFNTTASASYAKLMSSYVNEETAVGNDLYIMLDAVLVDSFLCEVKFASTALNTTVSVSSIGIGYGSPDSFTAWDTQN